MARKDTHESDSLLDSLRRDMADGKFDEIRERYSSVQNKLGVDPEDERYAVVEKIEVSNSGQVE